MPDSLNIENDPLKITYGEFNSLKRDMTDMKSLMSRMVETMGRISIIEERQHNHALISEKILSRVDEVTSRQHQADIFNATNMSASSRTEVLELAVREMHVENERQKTRISTIVWMVRGAWGAIGSGGLLWLFHAMTVLPVGK